MVHVVVVVVVVVEGHRGGGRGRWGPPGGVGGRSLTQGGEVQRYRVHPGERERERT